MFLPSALQNFYFPSPSLADDGCGFQSQAIGPLTIKLVVSAELCKLSIMIKDGHLIGVV